jgi:hypothetical protein
MSVLWHLFTSLEKSKQESKDVFFGSKHILPLQSLSLSNLFTPTQRSEKEEQRSEEVAKT